MAKMVNSPANSGHSVSNIQHASQGGDSSSFAKCLSLFQLFAHQTFIMGWKHLHQKRLQGRASLKEVLVPVFLIAYFIYIMTAANQPIQYADAIYDLRNLPPLSNKGKWGIFQKPDDDTVDIPQFIYSENLYYSPSSHQGVNEVMEALAAKYPQVQLHPLTQASDLDTQYEQHLFDTWASVEFDLTPTQVTTGQLVNVNEPSTVNYKIRISPVEMVLPDSTTDSDTYKDAVTLADAWANSGYLTIETFIANYLVSLYPESGGNDEIVSVYVQRYPKDNSEENAPGADMQYSRFMLWKWVASVILTVGVVLPILELATQIVRERQYKMKDLLEISGLMNMSYWGSYIFSAFIVCVICTWIYVLLLLAGTVITSYHVEPYAGLLTTYSLAVITFLIAFGFIVFRVEYYGLPAFLLCMALSVVGDYVADAKSLSIAFKLFLTVILPPVGFAVGIFQIETWIYHHEDETFDYYFVDDVKNLPSLASVNGFLIVSFVLYFFILWGMPFDWVFPKENISERLARLDEISYPCDNEEEDAHADGKRRSFGKVNLEVNEIHHIYDDGTQAVKGISFSVRDGEVLSFLGSNGAGKSTTMGMLCGTLPITFGDAIINGYSISRDKTTARRNLGICMQQDVIWDDISIIDHLYLFGRLRGMSGQQLKDDVDAMIQSLGFPEKAHCAAGTLSGGQKRRLCVGISMVGGNSVVFLDEPTAGLDPVSRRQLWELVQKNRHGRAILLTTHFMDEADVLGDRIAIVKDGRLRAIGSSKFLKNRFGMGYLLRMSLTAEAKHERIAARIMQEVRDASIVSTAGTELSLRLPKYAVDKFPDLFESIETNSTDIGVLSYGIETTTLEEVFMRIVNEDNDFLLQNHAEANKLLGASQGERDEMNRALAARVEKQHPLSERQLSMLLTKGRKPDDSTTGVFLIQSSILFWKRFHQFARSKGQWMMGVVVPLAIILICGVILYEIPDSLLYDDPDVTELTFIDVPTPVAASSEYLATLWAENAGISYPEYIGGNHSSLYDYLVENTETGNSGSIASVYFSANNNFTILFNATIPLSYAALVNNLIGAAVTNATDGLLTINAQCQPLAETAIDQQSNLALCFAFVISLIGGSLGAGISIIVSGERVSLVRHQQLASGASLSAYWFSNFLWDLLVGVIQTLALTLALLAANASDYSGDNFLLIWGIGVLFILNCIFRYYLISNYISDIKMAQTFFFYGSLLLMFVVCCWYILVISIGFDGNANNETCRIIAALCTMIDPAFGYFLMILFQNDFLGIRTQNNNAVVSNQDIGGYMITTLGITAAFFCVLFLILEVKVLSWFSFFCRPSRKDDRKVGNANLMTSLAEDYVDITIDDSVLTQRKSKDEPTPRSFNQMDPDVALEKDTVKNLYDQRRISSKQNAVFIYRLSKTYKGVGSRPDKTAVKSMSLTIGHGEIFGLLGANGAGKTTLLKMVSGLEDPSSGRALINGFDILAYRSEAQRSLGLCPQFDTLIERLTVRENLYMFANIKGLKSDEVDETIDAFMITLNIKKYENKLIQQLSGGNRRKVSLAVALLGAPPTIYLDEPSTGLDPVASRLMWRLLSRVAATKSCAVILTTHNMLECEAVCTRVGVMKNGELVCLGDSQHLRSTHGKGFLLEIHLNNPSQLDPVKQFINKNFSGATIVDEHMTMINFEIPSASIGKLSNAFRVLESSKETYGIVDYALSQSTLEQVFLKQIRPSENDANNEDKHDAKVPLFADYFNGYLCWLLAFFIPGLHHFYLGNTMRGVKYFFTINEVMVGWLLDIFEMHVLIRKSVEAHGNRQLCHCWCPHCGEKKREPEDSSALSHN